MTRRLTFASLVLVFIVGGSAGIGTVAAQGQREGIKVHGHWTIDIRNPDGTLATHREFENALIKTSNFPGGWTGATLLAGWLSRATQPGRWQILLWGPGGTGIAGGPNANPAQGGLLPSPCSLIGGTNPCLVREPGDGGNLTVGFNVAPASVELAGTATATVNGSIGAVHTVNVLAACLNSQGNPSVPDGVCQVAPLDMPFTGTPLAQPIPVVAKQIIQVTVTLTFS
jgi:hypothetical protein